MVVVVFNMVRIRHLVGLRVLQRVPVRSHRMPEEQDEKTEHVVRQPTGAVEAVVVRVVQELQR